MLGSSRLKDQARLAAIAFAAIGVWCHAIEAQVAPAYEIINLFPAPGLEMFITDVSPSGRYVCGYSLRMMAVNNSNQITGCVESGACSSRRGQTRPKATK
jgi:hypothetical protein